MSRRTVDKRRLRRGVVGAVAGLGLAGTPMGGAMENAVADAIGASSHLRRRRWAWRRLILGQSGPIRRREGMACAMSRGRRVATSGDGVDVQIPIDPVGPVEVQTQSGTLAVTPLDVTSHASDGTAVNGREAVVFANTGVLSDTSIVPDANGFETFTDIRGEAAAEDYSVKLDLAGDQRVEQIDESTVVVVDPTPTEPAAELPPAAAAGTPEADAARTASGLSIPDPTPGTADESARAAASAGTARPQALSGASDLAPSITRALHRPTRGSPRTPRASLRRRAWTARRPPTPTGAWRVARSGLRATRRRPRPARRDTPWRASTH